MSKLTNLRVFDIGHTAWYRSSSSKDTFLLPELAQGTILPASGPTAELICLNRTGETSGGQTHTTANGSQHRRQNVIRFEYHTCAPGGGEGEIVEENRSNPNPAPGE